MNYLVLIVIICSMCSCSKSDPKKATKTFTTDSAETTEACLERVLKLNGEPLKDKSDLWNRLKRPYGKCLKVKSRVVYMEDLSDENIRIFEDWD